MDPSHRRASVMIRRRRHGTRVQDYNICMGGGFGANESPGLELPFQCGAVRLCCSAAKVLYEKSGHPAIIMAVTLAVLQQLATFRVVARIQGMRQ